MKKKISMMVVAIALVVLCVVGGTLAWLTDSTESVQNTFTAGDIDITLAETTGTDYKMVPGYTITKNPTVTVEGGSEKAYLFVKVETSSNFDDFMTYEMAAGWTAVAEGSNVYCRVVDASEQDQDFIVLKDNKVTVKGEVTKAQMNALTTETYPTLTVTAYACQYMKNNTENFTVTEAWANAQPNS